VGEADVRSTSSAQRGRDQTASARAVLRAAEQVEDGFDAE
jgi:hypothetical protein